MTSQAAQNVSSDQIKLKKAMREIAPKFSKVNECIDALGDCEVLKKDGIRHVMLGDARRGVAEAYALFESSYAKLCDVHNGLTDLADEHKVDLSGITFNGGGGR